MKSKITFERKILAKTPRVCSGDRLYIDFIIDGVSLPALVGGVGDNIGKFGWKINTEFESSELLALRQASKSRLENGMYSLYVCQECGDEGCGALMINIEINDETVMWHNFFWSDGTYGVEEYPANRVDIKPIIFDRQEYYESMDRLKEMINEK